MNYSEEYPTRRIVVMVDAPAEMSDEEAADALFEFLVAADLPPGLEAIGGTEVLP